VKVSTAFSIELLTDFDMSMMPLREAIMASSCVCTAMPDDASNKVQLSS
jgi:hypothetical protein